MDSIKEININDIINELSEERELLPIEFSDTMSSEETNVSFDYIESELNSLYNKIRLLEQLHNYTELYVKQQIEQKENQFKEYLKTIEDVSDLYQDTNSVSYLVQFLASKDTIRDRDGSIIKQMNIVNSSLEVSGNILAKASLNNIIHSSDINCYNNNYNNLLKEKSGTSLYFSDNPIIGGILENIQITISNPQNFNYINIVPINATINNPKTIYESTENNIDLSHSYISPTLMNGLNFSLNCTDYNIGKKVDTINSPNTSIPTEERTNISGNTNKIKEVKNNEILKENNIKGLIYE